MSNQIMVTRRFEGKVGLVTGGASGIGLAISRRLVAEGANVVVGDVNEASLKQAKKELGNAIECTSADVRVEAQVEAMVRTATQRFGRLDVAFNVAGLGGFGEIIELAEADWDLVVDVCLKGVFLSVKHEARSMIAHGSGGAIVNVASLNSHVPMFGGVAYCCAKAGVEMLSRNAALELASETHPREHHIARADRHPVDRGDAQHRRRRRRLHGSHSDETLGHARRHGRGGVVSGERRRRLHLGLESVRRRRLGDDRLSEPAAVHVAADAVARRPTRQPTNTPISRITAAPAAIAFTMAFARIASMMKSR